MMIKDFSITLHYFATLCDFCVSAVKFILAIKNVPRGTLRRWQPRQARLFGHAVGSQPAGKWYPHEPREFLR